MLVGGSVIGCGRRGHSLSYVTLLDTLQCLQARSLDLQIAVFAHKLLFLVIKVFHLVSKQAGFGDLRKVHQAKYGEHKGNQNSMAYWPKANGHLKAHSILVAPQGLLRLISVEGY